VVSLVVPGSSEKMLAKARGLAVSELVIDLEDAVVADRKAEALGLTVQALAVGGFAASRVAVRLNPVGSAWIDAELEGLAGAAVRPDSIVVPKVSGPSDLSAVSCGIAIQALIETAVGLAAVREIAAVGAGGSLEAVILGYADLAVSLGRTAAGAGDLDLWLAVQETVLVAARAAGIRAIDGPFLTIADVDGLSASASRAAQLGFDGKWAIHPAQVAPIVSAFRPPAEAVRRAREVIAVLARAESHGAGAVEHDGLMIDEPVRLAALRTLALAGESAP